MRLLIVTQDFPPRIGGIENYTQQIALRLTEPENTTVVAPLVDDSSSVDTHLPFRVIRVPVPPNALPLALRSVLGRLLARERFDAALHAQWQTARFALQARDRGLLRRVFVATHGRELLLCPKPAIPRLIRAFERRRQSNLSGADLVFAVSRYTRDLALNSGALPDRMVVVPNGVDPVYLASGSGNALRSRLGARPGPLVLSVCRLVPRKDVGLILRSLPEVLSVLPDLVYVVVGDGPERKRLQALAAELGVNRSVRWEGRIPPSEIRHYFAACDLFVLTPRNLEPDVEGFGIVFLEAAAAGKPVVASDAGGIPDAVVHGDTGILISQNHPGVLAEAMIRVLTNPDLARQLAENGRNRVLDRMTWDAVAKQMREAMIARLKGTPSP